VLSALAVEGAALWPDGGSIHYRAPNPLSPFLRELVLANKPALLAHLAAWDAGGAIRLEEAADAVVAESGVSGRDPVIAGQAERCVRAHHAHDMARVRAACALIAERVRELITRRNAA